MVLWFKGIAPPRGRKLAITPVLRQGEAHLETVAADDDAITQELARAAFLTLTPCFCTMFFARFEQDTKKRSTKSIPSHYCKWRPTHAEPWCFQGRVGVCFKTLWRSTGRGGGLHHVHYVFFQKKKVLSSWPPCCGNKEPCEGINWSARASTIGSIDVTAKILAKLFADGPDKDDPQITALLGAMKARLGITEPLS